MKRLLVILTIIGSLLLSACQTTPSANIQGKTVYIGEGFYTNITATDLQSMLKRKDFVLVNVHYPYDGEIPKTELAIPYDEIDQYLSLLPADKNAKIVLYCRSDYMSGIAAETLVGRGYTNVWNLEGGMAAWEQAGFKLDFKQE